jgi:hypothetical protein
VISLEAMRPGQSTERADGSSGSQSRTPRREARRRPDFGRRFASAVASGFQPGRGRTSPRSVVLTYYLTTFVASRP